MTLELRRIIIFTDNMAAMAAFYGEVLGLAPAGEEAGWKSFAAGPVEIALHRGSALLGRRPPKLAFHAEDVAGLRAELMARGARMGRLMGQDGLAFCDGKDPDGNPFQISNRPEVPAVSSSGSRSAIEPPAISGHRRPGTGWAAGQTRGIALWT